MRETNFGNIKIIVFILIKICTQMYLLSSNFFLYLNADKELMLYSPILRCGDDAEFFSTNKCQI